MITKTLDALFPSYKSKELTKIEKIKDQILGLAEKYKKMTNSELQNQTSEFKSRLSQGETLDDILSEAFAVCREASTRVLGLTPYPVQLVGGIALHKSNIAEMKTGEGKTLVATLPVYLNALTGKGVHIITANEYLAQRDSRQMGRLYNFLGLSVGLIYHDLSQSEKKAAYNCDITYGTNSEFGFDYLRDNMVSDKSLMMQRGFNFAIIDEADSILIDEARTPLIISGQGEENVDIYIKCAEFAKQLRYCVVQEQDSKDEFDEIDEDVIVDEKSKTAILTTNGITKAEKAFDLENYSEMENLTIQHHINQAIRAQGIMKKDVDYVIKDDKISIVDEFTGRIMDGRRYNQGLHQAIEAKEQVKIEKENKTLATITIQNYFRMYKKLAGMTGTAISEENEFLQIYGLSVLEIPTNKPVIRKDLHDAVYKNEDIKFNAAIQEIIAANQKGQPVLVGTISVEKSEKLSRLLSKNGIKHEVLNAKNNEREAEIVAQAGKLGAVTIATNMAGRGTDIILGGNPEFMAKKKMAEIGFSNEMIQFSMELPDNDDEGIADAKQQYQAFYNEYNEITKADAKKVKDAGGLFIIGTERHESRRIDNQLRGRSGRQGDPGTSKFFVSLEDSIIRLFGGDKIAKVMEKLNYDESVPIENIIVSKSLENAQKRVEGKNFDIRKNVLNYDDVINKQREIIYSQRQRVLDGENLRDEIKSIVFDSVDSNVDLFCAGDDPVNWNLRGLYEIYRGWLLLSDDLTFTKDEIDTLNKETVAEKIKRRIVSILSAKEEAYTSQIMQEVERKSLLRAVDTKWMEHIDAMDELKKGIGLRGYAQHDPVDEYRFEGFAMFDIMIEEIKQELTKLLVLSNVTIQLPPTSIER